MAVKILAGPGLAPNDRIADAIRYAAQHADVLSCSWEVARHPDIESALDYAVTRGRHGKGSVVCVASGNAKRSRISFPASDEAVIAVGACNDRGRRSRYSNYGPGLTLLAPSSDDPSTLSLYVADYGASHVSDGRMLEIDLHGGLLLA